MCLFGTLNALNLQVILQVLTFDYTQAQRVLAFDLDLNLEGTMRQPFAKDFKSYLTSLECTCLDAGILISLYLP